MTTKLTDAQLTSQAAAWLGSLAKGKPKRITPEDSKRRSLRLAEARKRRWIKPTITERNTKPIV